MSGIKAAFDKADGALLVPYLTVGWPGIGDTVGLMRALEEGGAGLIELGVPFSDPSADGPVIQRANERALANGSGLRTALDATAGYRDQGGELPVVLMGYANPFMRMGVEGLAERAKDCGVDGVLAVDWPPGMRTGLGRGLAKADIDRIILVAPTTPPERMRDLGGRGSGYAYYVSMQGVTGGAAATKNAAGRAAEVREGTGLPVAVGFGVRTPEDCATLGKAFDAVVVGTRLLEVIEQAGDKAQEAATELMATMAAAMR